MNKFSTAVIFFVVSTANAFDFTQIPLNSELCKFRDSRGKYLTCVDVNGERTIKVSTGEDTEDLYAIAQMRKNGFQLVASNLSELIFQKD